MKLLFICGREPAYARNNIIIKALKKNKVDLTLCTSSSKNPFIIHLIVLLKFFFKMHKRYDAVFVGFYGQLLVPIIRLFTKKPIFFDAFMSAYDTMVIDKRRVRRGSVIAGFLHYIDKKSCQLADLVFLDTNQHIDYFVKEFKVPRRKFRRILIGADDDIFYPKAQRKQGSDLVVEFHGNFIPLQGAEYIVKAAKILEEENIEFMVIGSGQTFSKCFSLSKELKLDNINFIGRKNPTEIPRYISSSDIGLGIFGSTEKTKRVIPNKSYEIIAMMKPLVTADTKASRELFVNKENVLFCNVADEKSLAEAILTLKNNVKLRERIAKKGYYLFKNKCSVKLIGEQIIGFMESCLKLRNI
ncbi:glycosyl transferase family 1 [Candidatus Woesearchaeota archaeon]|nr:glycosyl transferase family 1 [Candidatus Woesearchaeota archaeon]|tara:strand:+ start:14795 stop:15865 length:1071 start_codon:yes stop_codon:yes gene_type:complete